MKNHIIIILLLCVSITSFFIGVFMERSKNKVAIISGPYSDSFKPTINILKNVKTKLPKESSGIHQDIDSAINHVKDCEVWTQKYLND